MAGALGFSFGDSGPCLDRLSMSTKVPITRHTPSLSVGANALSLGWAMRATVDLGLGGLGAGAWLQFTPGLALVADGSNPLSLKFGCVTESLSVTSKFGVGWSIPNFARTVINSILSAAHVKPIPQSGGPCWGPYPVWQPPQAQYCPSRSSS